jgi:release factor glutamine methyltransferase
MRSLREAIADITSVLSHADAGNARLDARVLIAHVLGVETAKTFTLTDMTLTVAQDSRLTELVQRRLAHEPVSRIVGKREFWGRDFNVTPDTLDPRPETETLISAAIDHSKRLAFEQPRILDLGTGTGCIVLSLVDALPGSTGVGVDLSEAALRVASGNAAKLGLSARVAFARMFWGAAVAGPFDIIAANPPYLSAEDMQRLEPEVRYDPPRALDGGADGLGCYRAIIADVKRFARSPAILAFEVGSGQATQVASLLEGAALRVVEIRSDLASIPRCVVAQI